MSSEDTEQNHRPGDVAMGAAQGDYDEVALGRTGLTNEYATEIQDGSEFNGQNGNAAFQHEEELDHGLEAEASHPATRASKPRLSSQANGGASLSDTDEFRAFAQSSAGVHNTRISDRESSYQKRRFDQELVNNPEGHTYKNIMESTLVRRDKDELERKITAQQEETQRAIEVAREQAEQAGLGARKKKRRWDVAGGDEDSSAALDTPVANYGAADATPVYGAAGSRWDATPGGPGGAFGETPVQGQAWDATPSRKKSRWDETPVGPATSLALATAERAQTLAIDPSQMTPALAKQMRLEREIDIRNRPMTDAELDTILPTDGYRILEPPANYQPLRTPSRKLLATPTPGGATGFHIQQTPLRSDYGIPSGVLAGEEGPDGLPFIKPEDQQHFAALLEEKDEEEMTAEEKQEREIMTLLLKIKNGLPHDRKKAMRTMTKKARQFGAGPIFNQVLPLMMNPALEEQERHLLVKVIDRVLYKLDELVRPYVRNILVVVEPMLIDQDYYARAEGREIISNLAKAAGLAHMIATMRPDIDNVDEYVRNTTARAFAVVASALGVPALLPFLRAVCQSKRSWQARHTGIKIVQQIAVMMGCAVLPHLNQMVKIIAHGLEDDNSKVRTITALAIAGLAEAAYPYGIESFDIVLSPLWKGAQMMRDKSLAAFLKAIGHIIPLMEPHHAAQFTRGIMITVMREFKNPADDMRKTVLQVVKQCVATEGVEADYVRDEILPEFFTHFWVRRMADDKRNYQAVVETTVEMANKAGVAPIIDRIVDDLKDENELYRCMVMEALDHIFRNHGAADITEGLEQRLMDGILYAYQDHKMDEYSKVILDGFGTIVSALGQRTKPYLTQICGTIKFRLANRSAKVRMNAAELVSRVAHIMKLCGQEDMLGLLGRVLYENLGEEYPEVLGSIVGGLKSILAVIGINKMQPGVRDLLPRMTPVLKNPHEKVQANTIELVGRIADRGANQVAPKEWMRICFDLLELLKAGRKGIRRAAVNTFGYIAKAVGPQDVLHTLLNNLRVQERQLRVCTTVAIAIVAETCQPFTVLPALMNEYRVPDLFVQNGVVKALSFMFEYIGEMAKDYIYPIVPLLEDALMDRDIVHRQLGCNAVKHLALGVQGLGCEDALVHLLNFVWPNIFETSPHLMNAVYEAIESLRVSLGPGRLMLHLVQGLYHPARRVREVYWKLYNNAYVYSADALTPFYPRLLEDDDRIERISQAKLKTIITKRKDVLADGSKDGKNARKGKKLAKVDHSGATAVDEDLVAAALDEKMKPYAPVEQSNVNNYARTYFELII